MSEGPVLEVSPKPIHKTPESVLARKRNWRRKNAEKIRARRAAHYQANLEEERAKGRSAGALFREHRRAQNRMPIETLVLYQRDPLREERFRQRDFVVCRECGAKHKSLHHHIAKVHQLTVDDYCGKWGFPLVDSRNFLQEASRRQKDWGALHGGKYFGGKRYVSATGEIATARRGKPGTAAMRRNGLRNSERLRGVPRLDRRGKKLLGEDRESKKWVQGPPADDAMIAELRLTGKSTKEIAEVVGLTESGAYFRLQILGFPTGAPCRFLHGEPVAKKHFEDLRKDFGATTTAIVLAAGQTPEFEVSRKSATYFGGKAKRVSGKLAQTYYFSLSNYLLRHKAEDVLAPRFADLVLAVRKVWTDSFCFQFHTGKRVRDFLASELRDLPEKVSRLRVALIALRVWLREQRRPVQEPEILNWVCEQSRREFEPAGPDIEGRGFRMLMFLWPELKILNRERPDLLAGRRLIEEVASAVLSDGYGAAAARIRQAAQGGLTALDSRTLQKLILTGPTNGVVGVLHKRRRGERGPGRQTPAVKKMAAACKKRGLSKRKIASLLYPDYGLDDAYGKTKQLFRNHPDIVAMANALTLSEADAVIASYQVL